MDHKELIEQLKNIRFLYADNGIKCEHICGKAAALIETILAELDAAVEDLTRICEDNPDACQCCKHMPCTETYGRCIGWQWRGPKQPAAIHQK